MADYNQMNNGTGDVVSGVDTVKKKKGAGLAIAGGLLAGVVVLGAGGGIAAYSLSDFVKNQVKLRVSKPENYYAWVTEKNSADFSTALSTKYGETIKSTEKGNKSAVSVKWDISDDVKNYLIEEAFGSDASYMDDDSQKLLDIINNLNSAKLGVITDSKDAAVSSSAYLEVNDERLFTFENALELEPFSQFYRIPELNEQWLGVDMSSVMDDEEIKDLLDSYKKFMEDPGSVLSPEELEKEIDRYVGVWNSSTEDVTIEKKEEVQIADITVNYTVATVEVDAEKARVIAENFINSAKEDEILRGIMTDRTGAVTNEEFDEALNGVLEEMKDLDDGDGKMIVKTYIDPKGDIRGVNISYTDDEENIEFNFMTGRDGDQIRGEFFVKEGGTEDFRIDLNAVDDNKKYTGDIDLKTDGETVSVEFKELEAVDEEKGYVNGTITFVIPDTDPIVLALSSDGKSQKISTDIVVEKMDCGKITLEFSVDEVGDPQIPSKKDAFMVDPEDPDFEITDYVSEENINGFISDTLTKLGLDKDTSKDLADGITGTLFYTYDYGDYDDWDFDYDMDIDDDWDIIDDDRDNDDDDDNNDGWISLVDEEDMNVAYIYVADKEFNATYLSRFGSLSDGASDAKITGNGTYTVSISAGGKVSPDGFSILNLNIDDMNFGGSPKIKITKLTIDGNEIAFTSEPEPVVGRDYINVPLYTDESFFSIIDNAFDGAAIGSWKKIEITFEISGIE